MLRWKGIYYLNFSHRNSFLFFKKQFTLHYLKYVVECFLHLTINLSSRDPGYYFFFCFNLSYGGLYLFCLSETEIFCAQDSKIIENSIGGRDLKVIWTNLLLKAGLVSSGYSGPILVSFKCLQVWRFHNLFGHLLLHELMLVLLIMTVKEVVLYDIKSSAYGYSL